MAIKLEESLRSIVRQIPDLVEVTVRNRTAGAANVDTKGLGVVFDGRRQPLTSGDDGGNAKRWARWQLYAIRDQPTTARPRRFATIIEADGTEWHVEVSQWRFGNMLFDCDCIQKVAVV